MRSLRTTAAGLWVLPALLLGAPARADIIGTLPALEATQRDRDLETVKRAFTDQEVRHKLERFGVSPADVDARVAALTDDELRELAEKVDSAPAGGGVLAVIGIVFVVLLILEAVGVIDIFRKFP